MDYGDTTIGFHAPVKQKQTKHTPVHTYDRTCAYTQTSIYHIRVLSELTWF